MMAVKKRKKMAEKGERLQLHSLTNVQQETLLLFTVFCMDLRIGRVVYVTFLVSGTSIGTGTSSARRQP